MCPGTRQHEIIEFGALRAAVTTTFIDPILRVRACSRWSERHGCLQDCLIHGDQTAAEEHGLLTQPLRRY